MDCGAGRFVDVPALFPSLGTTVCGTEGTDVAEAPPPLTSTLAPAPSLTTITGAGEAEAAATTEGTTEVASGATPLPLPLAGLLLLLLLLPLLTPTEAWRRLAWMKAAVCRFLMRVFVTAGESGGDRLQSGAIGSAVAQPGRAKGDPPMVDVPAACPCPGKIIIKMRGGGGRRARTRTRAGIDGRRGTDARLGDGLGRGEVGLFRKRATVVSLSET